jgi:hypothetical protein
MYSDGTAVIDPRARVNHSGTQLSSTISDLSTTVQAYRLDQFAGPSTDLSLASHKLTNVTDGTSAQDAATKGQLDAAIAALTSGQVIKGAVRCAATTNISLSSPGATIDTVSMTNGDVVLLTAQSTGSQNGPYVWTGASTLLVRADNWNTSGEAVLGSYWVVEQGSKADNYALLTNDAPITMGTDTPAFTFIGGVAITGSSTIQVASGVASAIRASGGGIIDSSGLAVDFGIVGKKLTGLIPTSTTAPVTVSGSSITINHGFNNWAPQVTIAAYTFPASGYTQGDLIGPGLNGFSAQDPNNVTGTLPGTLAANQWTYSIIG